MPSKYRQRDFEENGIYHVFNRGVEKRKIFADKQDYKIFIYYLFIYTSQQDTILAVYPQLPIRLQAKNLSNEVDLFAYCLMPNHLHLLLKQYSKTGISKLIKQLTNAYTEYFNKKYKRVGGLMQGTYKSAKVNTNEQLMHLSRYIHLNPVVSELALEPKEYLWSSYKDTIYPHPKSFVNSEELISLFGSPKKYDLFVKDQINYGKELHRIEKLKID